MHDLAPPADPLPPAGQMHPLVDRLVRELGYPLLDSRADLAAFVEAQGLHCGFVPGDARRNLETPDAAVVLPELRMAFQHAFDCAVIGDAIEADLRQELHALKTPSFLFWRAGRYLGAIEKVRDWADYMARVGHILSVKG